MNVTLSINKIADLSGTSHGTARRRLTQGQAQAEPDGKYSIRSVLQAWERIASGRGVELDAAAAKVQLFNLRIEKETIALRATKRELVRREPFEQHLAAVSKCLAGAIAGLGLDQDNHERCINEVNRVTREFCEQYNYGPMLSLDEAEEQEQLDAKAGGKE